MSKYKSHRGKAGGKFSFDKLLQVCSNSKISAATKGSSSSTGRFGSSSYSTLRKQNNPPAVLQLEDHEQSNVAKKPRLDLNYQKQQQLLQTQTPTTYMSSNEPYMHPVIHQTNIISDTNQVIEEQPKIFRPNKFFKSRNPPTENENIEDELSVLQTIPPHTQTPKSKRSKKAKEAKSTVEKEKKVKNSRTDVQQPLAVPLSSSNPTPIKLRIFKDKTTSKFVSVSDNLAQQQQSSKNVGFEEKKRRGRPKKNQIDEQDHDHDGRMPVLQQQEPLFLSSPPQLLPQQQLLEPPQLSTSASASTSSKSRSSRQIEQPLQAEIIPKPTGRTTRNSQRNKNSDSQEIIPPLPIITKKPKGVHYKQRQKQLQLELEQQQQQQQHLLNSMPQENLPQHQQLSTNHVDEDNEYNKISELLSSMENGSNQQQTSSQEKSYYSNSEEETTSSTQQQPGNQQDIRAILEDDWDSDSKDSPRKHSPEMGLSRFDPTALPNYSQEMYTSSNMHNQRRESTASIGNASIHSYDMTTTSSSSLSQQQNQQVLDQYPQQQQQQQQQQKPFNAPYAVRNLLNYNTNDERISYPEIEANVLSNSTLISEEKPGIDNNTNKKQPAPIKKSTIFKSRAAAATSQSSSTFDPSNTGSYDNANKEIVNPKKRLALYKHKFGQEQEEKNRQDTITNRSSISDEGDYYDDQFHEDDDGQRNHNLDLRKHTIASTSAFTGDKTKVFCNKESKNLFTVIKNVKHIHELQESGETHEFDGDVWYILEDLKDKNPLSNRCYSAITLAMRCMEQSFRMHLRAHGTVAEFCKELSDAPNNEVLALLASTILFVLSQDRLNMDLDTESLKLIIALSKTKGTTCLIDENPELAKHRTRVNDLCTDLKIRAKHLKFEKMTASELALETLLFLTSKRAGEWVKHELRSLGGLDYIVTEVGNLLTSLKPELDQDTEWSENVMDRLWKMDRCLRVLHQVTFNHEENQHYLLGLTPSNKQEPKITFYDSPNIFISIFGLCIDYLNYLPKDSEKAKVIREMFFSDIRLLVNLSHDYRGIVIGSEILGSSNDFFSLVLHSVFELSNKFTEDKAFDLLVHTLCLLLNLVEYSKKNQMYILSSTIPNKDNYNEEIPTIDAFVNLFLMKELSAKKDEDHTDNILTKGSDSPKKDSSEQSSSQETETSSLQDTIDKLVKSAGKHMENCLVAAHISLLLAYLIKDHPEFCQRVRDSMPERKFLPLMVLLKKLFNFMSITTSASGSTRGLKATAIALTFYGTVDPISREELKKIIPD